MAVRVCVGGVHACARVYEESGWRACVCVRVCMKRASCTTQSELDSLLFPLRLCGVRVRAGVRAYVCVCEHVCVCAHVCVVPTPTYRGDSSHTASAANPARAQTIIGTARAASHNRPNRPPASRKRPISGRIGRLWTWAESNCLQNRV